LFKYELKPITDLLMGIKKTMSLQVERNPAAGFERMPPPPSHHLYHDQPFEGWADENLETSFVSAFDDACALMPTQDDLPSCDGVPMETERHKKQMDLLVYSLDPWLGERGYVGGNMFVYYSPKQVKNEDFKGPDVFVTLGLGNRERKSWVIWQEGKSPDVVIELLSESTAKKDKTTKKDVYQNQLKVAEYFWFDPFNPTDFHGFRMTGRVYQELPLKNDCFTSQSLGLKLLLWHGLYKNIETTWLRWATLDSDLLLLPQEIEAQRADAESRRAEQERQQKEQAQERAERLAQILREHGIDPE